MGVKLRHLKRIGLSKIPLNEIEVILGRIKLLAIKFEGQSVTIKSTSMYISETDQIKDLGDTMLLIPDLQAFLDAKN